MRRLAFVPVVLLLGALGGCHKQAAIAPQPEAAVAGPALAPAGPKVDTAQKGKVLPPVTLHDAADGEVKLADLKGKPLLVNLWATWCVPCIKELPTLDALAAREKGRLVVAAVSQDLEGKRVVAPFLQKRGFKALTPYLDGSNALMLALKEAELPVTILYGADGREMWRVRGGFDWNGAKAKELLAQAGV